MPRARTERPRFCSHCGRAVVVVDATYCKECGAPLPATVWHLPRVPRRPLTILTLSLMPGLGHWYKGERLRGCAWFLVVLFLYIYVAPFLGFLVHMICAANAAASATLRMPALLARNPRRRGATVSATARPSS